mmetsp:Transcript_40481/g.114654  ORF Transcript_40481/g.114654 Transcript_40481/m.114654 type:complete len:260 (-) Transcript_40481:388-1167(-)
MRESSWTMPWRATASMCLPTTAGTRGSGQLRCTRASAWRLLPEEAPTTASTPRACALALASAGTTTATTTRGNGRLACATAAACSSAPTRATMSATTTAGSATATGCTPSRTETATWGRTAATSRMATGSTCLPVARSTKGSGTTARSTAGASTPSRPESSGQESGVRAAPSGSRASPTPRPCGAHTPMPFSSLSGQQRRLAVLPKTGLRVLMSTGGPTAPCSSVCATLSFGQTRLRRRHRRLASGPSLWRPPLTTDES